MKLEQQVVSLELAKKLKTLGVEQESAFYWIDVGMQRGYELASHQNRNHDEGYIAAFTVAELGEMLPGHFDGWFLMLSTPRLGSKWLVWYEDEDHDEKMQLKNTDNLWLIQANTEADARAKMLIYLLENKLLTL